MLLVNNIYNMSLITDFLLLIIMFLGFLYAITNKTKTKTIINKYDDVCEKDNKKKINYEDEQFKSEWYAIIKERIEYENKLSKEELNNIRNKSNKINWTNISSSSKPIAIKLLQEYPENISWNGLCSNEHPYAIELIKKYPGKINWSCICVNKNPDVIPLIKDRIELEKSLIHPGYYGDRISWENLVNNENAHELIIDRIEYEKKYWVNWMDNVKARYYMKLIEKIRIKDKKSLIIFKHVRDLDNFDWCRLIDTIITHL